MEVGGHPLRAPLYVEPSAKLILAVVVAGEKSSSTTEAYYIEAGSMSIFWAQNRALKTTSLARVLIRTWVRALIYDGTQIGLGGTRGVPALRVRRDPAAPSPSL